MSFGIILVGANLAMGDDSGYMVGALFAFMMLSTRVAQPLVGAGPPDRGTMRSFGAAVGEAAFGRQPAA